MGKACKVTTSLCTLVARRQRKFGTGKYWTPRKLNKDRKTLMVAFKAVKAPHATHDDGGRSEDAGVAGPRRTGRSGTVGGGKHAQGCLEIDCRACGVFHRMFVKDIEQSVPSLVSDQEGDNSPEATPSAQEEMSIVWGGQMQTPTPEKTAGGQQMGGAEASERPLRRMRTPFEQYVASCKSQGYDPEVLNRKGARTRGGGTNVSRGR
ncbi:hypothetical protein C1H76_8571 [Elsinoe australis]|uniref:Uncharacterized protein n=1 Tax=Elsinoe australis TaxID=40998 RepID=A0A4U7AQZ2_9PEZI|nr:hypothetical protein C1H76_8571 [Elsinoe australis]